MPGGQPDTDRSAAPRKWISDHSVHRAQCLTSRQATRLADSRLHAEERRHCRGADGGALGIFAFATQVPSPCADNTRRDGNDDDCTTLLQDLIERHIEAEGGVRWDLGPGTLLAVTELRGHHELGTFAHAHARDAHVPALDHFTDS